MIRLSRWLMILVAYLCHEFLVDGGGEEHAPPTHGGVIHGHMKGRHVKTVIGGSRWYLQGDCFRGLDGGKIVRDTHSQMLKS